MSQFDIGHYPDTSITDSNMTPYSHASTLSNTYASKTYNKSYKINSISNDKSIFKDMDLLSESNTNTNTNNEYEIKSNSNIEQTIDLYINLNKKKSPNIPSINIKSHSNTASAVTSPKSTSMLSDNNTITNNENPLTNTLTPTLKIMETNIKNSIKQNNNNNFNIIKTNYKNNNNINISMAKRVLSITPKHSLKAPLNNKGTSKDVRLSLDILPISPRLGTNYSTIANFESDKITPRYSNSVANDDEIKSTNINNNGSTQFPFNNINDKRNTNNIVGGRGRSQTISIHELKEANDVINKFAQKKFGDISMSHLNGYNKLNMDSLIKKSHLLYDFGSSLTNTVSKRNHAITKFNECLNVIYIIYQIKMNNNKLRDQQKSNIISLHMNVLLNLAGLYTLETNTLGKALNKYEEGMLLYDLDPNGFNKSNVNLKAWILRGMSDVYTKQGEYLSSLGLLEEALPLAIKSNDKVTEYQILSSKARALFESKQLKEASISYIKAAKLISILHENNVLPYTNNDVDLYRNAGLCHCKLAQKYSKKIIDKNTGANKVCNTKKSMKYWNKADIMYDEAIKITIKVFNKNSSQMFESLYDQSNVKSNKGDIESAYLLYKKLNIIYNQLDEQSKKNYILIKKNIDIMLKALKPLISNDIVSPKTASL